MAQPPPLELFLITLAQSQDDVVLEGVDADRRPARLAVSGFRPHFYVGPVADDADATSRQADLCRAAPSHAVSVTKVTRTFLCGVHEPRTYLRVAHRCGAVQSTLVRKCEQLWAEPPCEDGVPLLRRFLVETHLSGGAWLVAQNITEAGDRRYRCAHADVAGHAPDPLRQTFAAPRFASIPDLKVLALRVEPMTQVEIAEFLEVSRSLVSGAMSELTKRGLVRATSNHRNTPYEAVVDIWPTISDVLRSREWMLIESARVALEGAIEEVELAPAGAPARYQVDRMRFLMRMTELAQAFLRLLIGIRVPRKLEGIGDWLKSSAKFMQGLRELR